MTSEMYSSSSSSNYWPAFQQQQLQPFTYPSTAAATAPTIIENCQPQIEENQPSSAYSTIEVKENVEPSSSSSLTKPFQLTAASEGIQLDELKERIKVKLVEEKLFNKFKDVQLEMVITKAGRNLFPKLNFMVEGLEPENCYLFSVKFKRVNNLKYKYTKSQWIEIGPADDEFEQKEYPHVANARFQNGKQWMETDISFASLKLTNNQDNPSKNAVVLRSLHKYCPVLIIYRFDPDTSLFDKIIEKEITCSSFIAVTAYQNSAVTKLKVDNNPFARGFREGGRKRLRNSNTPSESDETEATGSPPSKQQQLLQTNPLLSTPFFNTLNYFQNWYNPNMMISNQDINNYYAQAFQAQNVMFNPQNFMFQPSDYESSRQ